MTKLITDKEKTPKQVVHYVRCRGGNLKRRGLALETGNYSWATEKMAAKTRILDVVYNASNNELERTQTLVKNTIVQVDATPFRQFLEKKYGIVLTKTSKKDGEQKTEQKTLTKKQLARQAELYIPPLLRDQLISGKVYACISSRPGQSGRADGYILEGEELEFYKKKIDAKKAK